MRFLLFIFFASCIGLPVSLPAKHLMGGSMGYYYDTNGQLMVEMLLYRDCNAGGAPFDQEATIAIYTSSGTLYTNFVVQLTSHEPVDLTNGTCFSSNLCIEKGAYTFPLHLPENDSTFMVVYQRCCRRDGVTNIVNSGMFGFTIGVEIRPEARYWHNNSPRWLVDPTVSLCVHETAELSLSASEPDGDLLQYAMCAPLTGGGSLLQGPELYGCDGALPTPPCAPPYDSIQFVEPTYTAANPLGASTASFNLSSGVWTVTPELLGQFTYATSINEYRNGTLLSHTWRELLLYVEDVPSMSTDAPQGMNLVTSPNPADGTMTVDLSEFVGTSGILTIQDISGKIWLTLKSTHFQATETLKNLNMPAGIYVLKVSTALRAATGRFFASGHP